MSVRMFIALALPEGALDALVQRQSAIVDALGDEQVRAVARGQLHLTLAFLADREEAQQDAIVAAIERHTATWHAFALQPGALRTFGGGRVLGLDVEGRDARRLERAQAPLAHELTQAGLMPHDARPWHPHLSIVRGRGRRGAGLRPPPDQAQLPPFVADRVALVASLPAGAGREYRVLHERVLPRA